MFAVRPRMCMINECMNIQARRLISLKVIVRKYCSYQIMFCTYLLSSILGSNTLHAAYTRPSKNIWRWQVIWTQIVSKNTAAFHHYVAYADM